MADATRRKPESIAREIITVKRKLDRAVEERMKQNMHYIYMC